VSEQKASRPWLKRGIWVMCLVTIIALAWPNYYVLQGYRFQAFAQRTKYFLAAADCKTGVIIWRMDRVRLHYIDETCYPGIAQQEYGVRARLFAIGINLYDVTHGSSAP